MPAPGKGQVPAHAPPERRWRQYWKVRSAGSERFLPIALFFSVTNVTALVLVSNYVVRTPSLMTRRAALVSTLSKMEKEVAHDRNSDPTQTYVLEETSITRLNSLDELAELALRQGEGSPAERSERGGATSIELDQPRAAPRR